MFFASWLRRFRNSFQPFGKRRVAQRQWRHNARPSVEALEDRCVPSVAGSLDPTFGNGAGYVTTSLTSSADQADYDLVQPDGKILAAGSAWSGNGIYQASLVRYNADGTLDTSFGNGGEVLAPPATGPIGGTMALYPTTGTANDGKIVLTEFSTSFSVARYNPNGTLDTSFGTNGIATANFGSTLGTYGAVMATVQPDGKIVAVGCSSDKPYGTGGTTLEMARFNVNGSLDTTFGNGGLVTTSLASDFVEKGTTAPVLQPNGSLILTVNATGSGGSHFDLVGYNANGSLNTSFGTNGFVRTPPVSTGDFYDGAAALYPTAGTVNDGKIVMAGYGWQTAAGPVGLLVRRYNPNGTLDATFGNNGLVFTPLGRGAQAYGVVLQPDGKIVVSGLSQGATSSSQAVVRYNTDGSLDASFGPGGVVTTAIGTNNVGNDVALQSNGEIVVAGAAIVGKWDFTVTRYLGQANSTYFVITGSTSLTAGTAAMFTISVMNSDGTVDTGYSGTLHITSSDPQAVLPVNFTITGGTTTFSATLKTGGLQSLTATDTVTGNITGSDASIQINPGAATHFVLSGPSSVDKGTAFSLTVTALDAYGNVATDYTGTVHFADSAADATLPANYTFSSSNGGVNTFTSLKLKTRGWQTITITDTLVGTILGSWTIDVT